ncbi:MAG: SIMPL domain-containing protein [Holosporaceae bacterium]|jgi:hypothetical protein|nr:SIMPL domain-containing protein [Holosporaceae bacterium]
MRSLSLLGSALIIAGGLVGFGYFSKIHSTQDAIEVKGLSEKVVRADVGNMCIAISNRDENLEKLYIKRAADKVKLTDFLKNYGIIDEEITDSSMDTSEREEEETVSSAGATTVKKTKYYKSEDKLSINTRDLEKIEKIKEGIIKLSSEGIFISYSYSYDLTSFLDIKIQMLKEASENSKKNAEAFVEPHGQKIGDVVYLRQGEITIRAENESENIESWHSTERTSLNKKLRLVVRAGFKKCSK